MKKIFAALFLLTSMEAFSELSGEVYSKWAASAPEALTLKVLKVNPTATKDGQLISMTAQVIEVQRTKSNLVKGNTIIIEYEIIELAEDEVGPAPMPLLQVGDVVPGFLIQSGKVYKPAAQGHSFAPWLWETQFN